MHQRRIYGGPGSEKLTAQEDGTSMGIGWNWNLEHSVTVELYDEKHRAGACHLKKLQCKLSLNQSESE